MKKRPVPHSEQKLWNMLSQSNSQLTQVFFFMMFSSMDRDWAQSMTCNILFTHEQPLNDERLVGAGALVDRL